MRPFFKGGRHGSGGGVEGKCTAIQQQAATEILDLLGFATKKLQDLKEEPEGEVEGDILIADSIVVPFESAV